VAFLPQEQTTLLRCLRTLERRRESSAAVPGAAVSVGRPEEEAAAAAAPVAAAPEAEAVGAEAEAAGAQRGDAEVAIARVRKRRRDEQGDAEGGRHRRRGRHGRGVVAVGGLVQMPVRTWVGWGWRGAPLASRVLGPRW
jgi:hypothetical protein